MITGIIKAATGLGLTVAGAALIVAGGTAAHAAASSTGTTTGNVTVNSTITLSGLAASFTLTGNVGASPNTAVTSNVVTNSRTGYTVSVQASGATLAGTGGNLDTIAIALLQAKDTSGGTYASVSNSAPTTVHSQATKSIAAGDAISTTYQLNVIPFVNADTYSTTITETATTQ